MENFCQTGKIEHKKPSIQAMAKIAKALGVPMEDLVK